MLRWPDPERHIQSVAKVWMWGRRLGDGQMKKASNYSCRLGISQTLWLRRSFLTDFFLQSKEDVEKPLTQESSSHGEFWVLLGRSLT